MIAGGRVVEEGRDEEESGDGMERGGEVVGRKVGAVVLMECWTRGVDRVAEMMGLGCMGSHSVAVQ